MVVNLAAYLANIPVVKRFSSDKSESTQDTISRIVIATGIPVIVAVYYYEAVNGGSEELENMKKMLTNFYNYTGIEGLNELKLYLGRD